MPFTRTNFEHDKFSLTILFINWQIRTCKNNIAQPACFRQNIFTTGVLQWKHREKELPNCTWCYLFVTFIFVFISFQCPWPPAMAWPLILHQVSRAPQARATMLATLVGIVPVLQEARACEDDRGEGHEVVVSSLRNATLNAVLWIQ